MDGPPAVPSLKDTTQGWKTIPAVREVTAQRLKAVEMPAGPVEGLWDGELAQKTAKAYNDAYEKRYRQELAPIAFRAENSRPFYFNHKYKYGDSGIDQTTLDLFGGLNLDLGSMTSQDRLKVYQHELLEGDEKQLPLSAAVALLKVKLLDRRAELIDRNGPRRVDYEDIPQTASPWAQKPVEPPKKKGWLSRAAESVGNTAKKLKFW